MQNPNELNYGMPSPIGPQGPTGVETTYPQGRPSPMLSDPEMARQGPSGDQYGASLTSFGSAPPSSPSSNQLPQGVMDLGPPPGSENVVAGGKLPDGIMDLEKPVEQKREEPGFMKKLDAINTGVHRGVTHFTYKLLSMIPSEKGRANLKAADKRLDEEQAINTEAGLGGYAKGGEIAGEMLATLPMAGPYGGVLKGASLAGKMAPMGLKTAAKYGAAGVGGAGLFAAQESQRYDPENPDQLLNTEAAGNALSSPMSYALPMVGAKIGTWAEKSRKLQQGRETISELLPRDVMEKGASKTFANKFFDSLPSMTGAGKRVRQIEGIGDDIHEVVRKVSGGNDAVYSKDLIKFAGAKLQGTLQNIKKGQSDMWNKPFRGVMVDSEMAKSTASEAFAVINDVKSAIPLANRSQTILTKILSKKNMTVDDVKNAQSTIGDVISSVRKADTGGVGRDVVRQLSDIRTRLMDPIQKSLSGDDLKDFMAAKEYSSRFYKMQEEMPKIKKAMVDEIAARKLIKDVMSNTEMTNKSKVMGLMDGEGLKAMRAAKIAEALEASDVDGKINLTSFIQRTSEATKTPELLGESYKSIQGLNKYLSSINESQSTGFGKLGMAAAATITYPATTLWANHPVLKKLTGALTKNMPDSTYNYLTGVIQRTSTRAGFFMTDEGTMKHKSEEQE